ncbi:HNH endonuclease [Celeribacter halophilus]|uniref:HNH endonuclease n=1 Tax=Celeribacter halophilus TaxID=576117 RepID=UPI001C0867C6|nr:HNH endonuclease [Celeribacter halophilus]MBU2889091.1 HNH endonuclease [Celeribacter halophilus]MDO6510381.1 HNH endonuclease [Celeribacter halophilus]
MSVSEAIEFVCEVFFDPTIEHPDCGDKVRNIAKNYRTWARVFTHTGNLYDFLKFLEGAPDTEVISNQSRLGLKKITELIPQFEMQFQNELDERLDTDGLQVGQTYPTHMIHAICGSYDLRSGGILPVLRHNGKPEFVAIKATLSGGTYPNEWLDRGRRLKYFMKAISGTFKETYQDNAAIINNPQSPVLVFVRNTDKEKFTYWGRFFPFAIHTENDGSKWFELVEWSNGLGALPAATAAQTSLDEQVQQSIKLDPEARRRRLAEAPQQPEKQKATTTIFKRNPDVIAEVLFRANGICEACHAPAPFERLSDGTPYLEVHHKIPLAKDGPDTVENAVALCPNCHRREHSGPAVWSH